MSSGSSKAVKVVVHLHMPSRGGSGSVEDSDAGAPLSHEERVADAVARIDNGTGELVHWGYLRRLHERLRNHTGTRAKGLRDTIEPILSRYGHHVDQHSSGEHGK